MSSSGLSWKDAQVQQKWSGKIEKQPANPGSLWKWPNITPSITPVIQVWCRYVWRQVTKNDGSTGCWLLRLYWHSIQFVLKLDNPVQFNTHYVWHCFIQNKVSNLWNCNYSMHSDVSSRAQYKEKDRGSNMAKLTSVLTTVPRISALSTVVRSVWLTSTTAILWILWPQ